MRTFLESNLDVSKSFVLYGNIDDSFISPDLVKCNFEQYLLKILKSRGYRYVIFYGGSGARGAYCLDGTSARFFFHDNKNLPPVPAAGFGSGNVSHQSSEENGGTSANPSVEQQYEEEIINSFVNFDDSEEEDYVPGNIPQPSNEEAAENLHHVSVSPGSNPPTDNAQVSASTRTDTSGKVIYQKRRMQVEDFLQEVHFLISNPDYKIAAIFYNFQTTEFKDQLVLDNITYLMEVSGGESIILFCMPTSSADDDNTLMRNIENARFNNKFLIHDNNSFRLNPDNCIRIRMPQEDEIANYLRYLAIVGTKQHHKITFPYSQLEKYAQRVLIACQTHNSQYHENRGRLKDIMHDMEYYIDSHTEDTSPLALTPEKIDEIWRVSIQEGTALQELKKRGWENVYKAVCHALETAKGISKNADVPSMPQKEPDYATERLQLPQEKARQFRPPIPNFLLLGPPGTGKSTTARLIGRILQEAGILKKGHTHEVGKINLVNSFVAGIPGQVMEQVEKAEEGVLFIDEINQIAVQDGGVNNEGSARDIVSTLNHAVTDPGRHFCLIGAGYEKDIDKLFDVDSGFKDRFTYIISIDSYTPDILFDILLNMIKAENYTVAPDLLEEKRSGDTTYIPLMCMLQRVYDERNRESFRNAGVMKDMAQYAIGSLNGKNTRNGTEDRIITMECFYGAKGYPIDETWFTPMDVEMTLDSVMSMMEERFVGMKSVKETVRKIGNRLMDAEANNLPTKSLKPMLFVGNAGTGKTQLAYLLPKLLYHYHVIGTSKPMIVSALSLSDRAVGGAKENTAKLIKKAQDQNAFVFIDECNCLTEPYSDGKDIIQTMLKPITDAPEKPFVLAMAVYPSKEKEFIRLDDGVQSRFEVIRFDDYDPEELFEIFRRLLKKNNKCTDSDTDNILRQVMYKAYINRTPSDGNGRFINNLFDDMDDRRIERCIRQNIPLNSEEACWFRIEDIPEHRRKGMVVEEPTDITGRLQRLLDDFSQQVVGMENVKQEMKNIAYEAKDAIENGKEPHTIRIRSIILVGNPGVGKSKVANMIPAIYESLGVLRHAVPIRINAASLSSDAELEQKMAEAKEKRGMLFVDEAHNLIGTKEHFFRQFMAPTTDEENSLFVCFVVYPNQLDAFLSMDIGALSRFRIIRIDDYTGEELMQIFNMMMTKDGFSADEETAGILRNVFENAANGANERTGNGRFVETYLETLKRNRNHRCVRDGISFSDSRGKVFIAEDIPEDDRKLHTSDVGSKLERLTRLKNTIENERIGFVRMKEILISKVNSLIYQEKYPAKNKQIFMEPGHYFFMGNPGTGKTTCAEYVARYLFEMGLINDPVPKIINAGDLIGRFLGHSEHQTKQILSNARGKLLMIDEAYALAPDSLSGNEFKSSVIDEIISTLDSSEFRKNTAVVFAGYKDDLRKLYNANKGFKSRLTEIEFNDFTLDESMSVLQSMLDASDTRLNDTTKKICQERIEYMMSKSAFSNGRTIRRFASSLCEQRNNRCIRENYAPDDPRVTEIQPEDIPSNEKIEHLLNL